MTTSIHPSLNRQNGDLPNRAHSAPCDLQARLGSVGRSVLNRFQREPLQNLTATVVNSPRSKNNAEKNDALSFNSSDEVKDVTYFARLFKASENDSAVKRIWSDCISAKINPHVAFARSKTL